MFHRVVLTGIGVVSPYGVGVEALWQRLKSSKNPLHFDETLKVVVGAVPSKESDPRGLDLSKWSSGQQREMTRGAMLASTAADEAIEDACLKDVDHTETGINIGMGIADLEAICDTGLKISRGEERRISPFFVPKILTNIPTSYISIKYGMKGGNSSSTTACATGASCIGDAFTNIKIGRQRRVLAGGVESCLHPIAVQGFKRMRALASKNSERISRPFDKDREGFVLSEGAAVLILERADDAMKRNAKIYAEILGYGLGNDAFHLTSPSEDGFGSTLCIRRALADASIKLEDCRDKYDVYVNAHATSTPVGDAAEAKSIANLLPGAPVSSIKGHIGHTLGAAGAIETAVTALSISESLLIGTLNLETSGVAENIHLLREIVPWETSLNKPKLAIKNSFGFGGSYVSLVLSEFRP